MLVHQDECDQRDNRCCNALAHNEQPLLRSVKNWLTLGGPVDGGVLDLPFYHLVPQLLRALANSCAGCKMAGVRSIGLGPLADIFVIMRHALIG